MNPKAGIYMSIFRHMIDGMTRGQNYRNQICVAHPGFVQNRIWFMIVIMVFLVLRKEELQINVCKIVRSGGKDKGL